MVLVALPTQNYCVTTVDPSKDYSLFTGFIHLGAGLSCGLTGLAAGYAIGIVGDAVSSSICLSYFQLAEGISAVCPRICL